MTGKELAMLRRRAGLSQAALAQRVGVSRQTISYWESRPALDGSAANLKRIAHALDPKDRKRVLGSRPGLGFITLCFTSPVSPKQLNLIRTALERRKTTLAEMRRQTCGAMTRMRMECQLKSEPGRKRCRLHGGLSTGPKTAEGRARIAEAQRKRRTKQRKARESPENT